MDKQIIGHKSMGIIVLCFITMALTSSFACAGEGGAFTFAYIIAAVYYIFPVICICGLCYYTSEYFKTKNKDNLFFASVFIAGLLLFIGFYIKIEHDIDKKRIDLDLVPADPVQRQRFLNR